MLLIKIYLDYLTSSLFYFCSIYDRMGKDYVQHEKMYKSIFAEKFIYLHLS